MTADKTGLSGLHIGTSGWSYKHWAGIFYPEEIKPAQYLEYYVTKFGCVELNSSFYHLPKKATVEGWMKRTPDSFVFCPKLSRYITHQLRLINIEEPMERFFGIFEELKIRMGPVLVQLPPGLAYNESVVHGFLDLLREKYSGYRVAIEARHKSWISENFFKLLVKYGIAFVIADSGERYPCHETVTTDFVYLRFHGHEQLYASEYGETKLAPYAEKIIQWFKEGKEVWVFFNNDFNGFAIRDAEKLQRLIRMF